ncbi:MAG: DUF2309 domain-containing protein [Candidatus Accumulibacter sp.]|nr:DUF2309 domain-containing protein [Accumulibacter sp.]
MSAAAHDPRDPQQPAIDDDRRLADSLHRLAHHLPAQAPLRDFVHHNTLHAFQHLPFRAALEAAARLNGARPWMSAACCRELFRRGRIDDGDLDAALRQMPELAAEQRVLPEGAGDLRRGQVLRQVLLRPPETISLARLRWLRDERAAFERLPDDLDGATRHALLSTAMVGGLDEAAAVADLWAAAREASRVITASMDDHLATVRLADATPADASHLWQQLHDRLGRDWTILDLLAHLTGEDLRRAIQPALIRHLAGHLDQGVAAWRNPKRAEGLYAAWRYSAGRDWSWELDEFPGTRLDIQGLPDQPMTAIAGELRRLGIAETRWSGYLEALAQELPGWAGMAHWRETRPATFDAPVALADLLAIRLIFERLYAEQLVRRLWGLPLAELGGHFVRQPVELALRHAFGQRRLSEELLDILRPRLNVADGNWRQLAAVVKETPDGAPSDGERRALVAWPLFVLACRLGLCGRQLRAIGDDGVQALWQCATSLSDGQRGMLWLLAYEHHFRQQIFVALTANHRRAQPLAGRAVAQLVLCMDDREEGTRRHLEEVNPAYETFGAAGFFGVPILWHGLDDELPTALCPIVVRPANAVIETVPARFAAQGQRHRQRRRQRLRWREHLHQGTRRGWLLAALLNAAAGPLALLTLLCRTLTPGAFGGWLEHRRLAFEIPLPTEPQVNAVGDEAHRPASADAPRQGFNDEEQVARVGNFLRSIGLTRHFAPLVVIVGHGSDSRNNPHRAAYDCGACSGRHGGPNARVFATLANLPSVRARLAEQGLSIPVETVFVGAEHNTCDESFLWYDEERIPASHQQAFAALRRDCAEAARRHAVERCRRFASAPPWPTPAQAMKHLANRRHDLAQSRPELGHATVAAALIGRRTMSRGVFFDRRVFLISYDPLADADGQQLEAILLAAGPVGAGISLEYYFSTVDNDSFGCGSKVMHNLAGLFAVMQGASSDLRTGLPVQMIEIHEAMRLLVVVEQTPAVVGAIYQRQPPLQELIGNGWIVLATQDPESAALHLFDPAQGWQPWHDQASSQPTMPEVDGSADWFAGRDQPLPPALLRRPVRVP